MDALKSDSSLKHKLSVQNIDNNVQILNSQVDQIIDFSMLQKGEHLALDFTSFRIRDLFNKMKRLFSTQTQFKNISMKFQESGSIENGEIVNDKTRLENVMIDLI